MVVPCSVEDQNRLDPFLDGRRIVPESAVVPVMPQHYDPKTARNRLLKPKPQIIRERDLAPHQPALRLLRIGNMWCSSSPSFLSPQLPNAPPPYLLFHLLFNPHHTSHTMASWTSDVDPPSGHCLTPFTRLHARPQHRPCKKSLASSAAPRNHVHP
ncbi:uncharacterized protein BDZ99DRAFT_109364 [Mytilinidion resinicola]|uniref:Uncharacterized protein n=1 Tax=Mytilinidion resinicola TaxID=574789 RepID=A0A6A6YC37_9PEZI|nr:uncharacterized protein BDZ99DRAFT_109364 [Mytilinidion resinicola]KAF2805665.1 hypothetical protein BDZ99DRAFT_109364 [Mytilinidion resinicola]